MSSVMVNKKMQDSVEKLQSLGRFRTEEMVYGSRGFPNPNRVADAVNLPYQFLVQMSPYITQQIFGKTTAEQLVGTKVKVLDWDKNVTTVPFLKMAGQVGYYDDFSPPSTATVQYQWAYSGHLRLSIGMAFGRLESMQFSSTGLDLYNKKVEAALMLLRQALNQLYWYGFPSSLGVHKYNDLQGILTSKILANPITPSKKIGGANYTYNDGYNFFTSIINEFVKNTKGYTFEGTKIKVGLSTAAWSTFNSLTILAGNFAVTNLLTMVQQSLPIEVILCPELDKAGSGGKDMAVAIVDRLPNALSETAVLGFSEDALFSDLIQNMDSYYGKISAGCCGFLPLYPQGILRYTDIMG